MTRTEFDAAFKLALGYVVSEKIYFIGEGRTPDHALQSTFKTNGIRFVRGNLTAPYIKKFITYDKLIDFIPHIRKQIKGVDEMNWIVNIHDDIYAMLER